MDHKVILLNNHPVVVAEIETVAERDERTCRKTTVVEAAATTEIETEMAVEAWGAGDHRRK